MTGQMGSLFWTRLIFTKSMIRQHHGQFCTTQNGALIVIRLRHSLKILRLIFVIGRRG